MHGDALRVRVNAPPVNGRANRALCSFLAELVGVPLAAVHIVSGHTGRRKAVFIAGIDAQEARRCLKLTDG